MKKYLPAPTGVPSAHTSHCCNLHGCKYSDPSCAVANGFVGQEFPCPYCVTQEQLDGAMQIMAEAQQVLERFGKLQRYSW